MTVIVEHLPDSVVENLRRHPFAPDDDVSLGDLFLEDLPDFDY